MLSLAKIENKLMFDVQNETTFFSVFFWNWLKADMLWNIIVTRALMQGMKTILCSVRLKVNTGSLF